MNQLKSYYQTNLLFFLFILVLTISPISSNSEELNINEQVDEISKKLRCLVCQNQTIYESEADFSKQLKSEIKKQLEKNKKEQEIIDFIVERYGEYVLLKPKFDKKNLFLWLFPFIIFIGTLGVFYLKLKK